MNSRLLRLLGALTLTGLVASLSASPALAATRTADPVGGPLLGTTGTVVQASPGTPALPKLSALSFVLADADTGEILAAKDPHGRLRPASTLKTLTAVTLLPRLDPATVYTAQWEDAHVDGSKVGIVPGGTYTVHDLFQGMFLISGNDAANALANVAGGVPQTVALMNAKAKALGALDTTVVNPSGLDADGQLTSAYDLALFARAGLARPDFRAYVSTIRSRFPGKMPAPGKPRPTFEIFTQNRLVLNYPGAIGVKTGWTTLARGTFSGAATRGGRTLIATVMHTGPRSWKDSAALLDWGFANASRLTPVGTLVQPHPAQAASVRRPAVAAPPVHAGASGGWLPWYVWTLVAVLLLLTALRTRVLVLRRIRRRYPSPLLRDLTSAPATPAPATAPSTMPRQRRLDRDAASTGPTGTGS